MEMLLCVMWHAGVMLYEMLTGEPPFDGESEEELFASILTKRIKCPRWLRADTALVCAL